VTSDTVRLRAIRRADAMTNAATVLMDAEEERRMWGDIDPEVFADIARYVIPLLEAEADKGSVRTS
jgi:hypothetical protein